MPRTVHRRRNGTGFGGTGAARGTDRVSQAPFHASVLAAFRRHLAGMPSRAETTDVAIQAAAP